MVGVNKMSVFVSYDDGSEWIATKLLSSFHDEGFITIHLDHTRHMTEEHAIAIEDGTMFIPLLCKAYERNPLCRRELSYAMAVGKWILPVLVEPERVAFDLGCLFTGLRISDVSSLAKYETELPQIIRTLRAIMPAVDVGFDEVTASAEVDQDTVSGSTV